MSIFKLNISRRALLRKSIASASLGYFGVLDALAQAGDYKALVCVFLFGGNGLGLSGSDGSATANARDRLSASAARSSLSQPEASIITMACSQRNRAYTPASTAHLRPQRQQRYIPRLG